MQLVAHPRPVFVWKPSGRSAGLCVSHAHGPTWLGCRGSPTGYTVLLTLPDSSGPGPILSCCGGDASSGQINDLSLAPLDGHTSLIVRLLQRGVMGTAEANGAVLFYEVRGEGPPVVFVSGATGDGGFHERTAEALASVVSNVSIVTYDRRGNSRSPRPDGWSTTSMEEQGADLAALIDALGRGPAVAVGSSMGCLVALACALTRPTALRGVILHEPPVADDSSRAADLADRIYAVVSDGMRQGGPPVAMEQFLRKVAIGDALYEKMPLDLRSRVLGNGEVAFAIEGPAITAFRPDCEQLESISVPAEVLVGADSADPQSPTHMVFDAGRWLADLWGVQVRTAPGGHAPSLSHPREFADTIATALVDLDRRQTEDSA